MTSPERQQTDESLAHEREQADLALADHLTSVDVLADAVINRARARADGVLAMARAKTDRKLATTTPGGAATTGTTTAVLTQARATEDAVLRDERAAADEVMREEREEHVALLARERKETDDDLDAERDRADELVATRDELLGIVSHDLRNILNVVMGFTSVIGTELTRLKLGEDLVKDAAPVQRWGARMDRLIGDLVDVAGIHAGVLTVSKGVQGPVPVVAEAVETFQALVATRGVSVFAGIVPPLPKTAFDAARVMQVLTNLLRNALKFTPSGGRVVVRLEGDAQALRFSVADTGKGIPAERLVEVFDRDLKIDVQDKRGAGLGLYISKCIVGGHGGKTWAESVVGAGTTVRFTLPARGA